MNMNQFLQTARTVTFLIQKKKAEIPNFEAWYSENILRAWKDDVLMRWAVESRNTIEKEGDLELHSTLSLSLMFSYLEELDLYVQTENRLLLYANLKQLIRFAQKELPSGMSDAAVVKVERRWVASSLPDWELLQVINYVYARLFECCDSLACHLGSAIDVSIRQPGSLELLRERARHVEYVKLHGLKAVSLHQERLKRDENFTPPSDLLRHIQESPKIPSGQGSFEAAFEQLVEMAVATFNHYSHHIPMLHFFDESWRPIGLFSTHFEDHADKFIFWRHVADQIRNTQAKGLMWISESWVRKLDPGLSTPTRNLPIIGEHLQIVGVNSDGQERRTAFRIVRPPDAPPRLELEASESSDKAVAEMYFLRPAIDALRNPYSRVSGSPKD